MIDIQANLTNRRLEAKRKGIGWCGCDGAKAENVRLEAKRREWMER